MPSVPACAEPSGKTVATDPTVTCSIMCLMLWTVKEMNKKGIVAIQQDQHEGPARAMRAVQSKSVRESSGDDHPLPGTETRTGIVQRLPRAQRPLWCR